MSDVADRRQFWRAAFHASVYLVAVSETVPAELLDISLKGALVAVPADWPAQIGDFCELRLKLADDATIVMDTIIAHQAAGRVGLRCERIDLDSIIHLRRLVELNAGDAALLDRELQALLNG